MSRTYTIEAEWSLWIFYDYYSFLVAKFKGFWSLDFLVKNQNSCRGPIFEISKGVSNMFSRLYTIIFYVFCHSFWCTTTLQRNLEISYFRSYPTVYWRLFYYFLEFLHLWSWSKFWQNIILCQTSISDLHLLIFMLQSFDCLLKPFIEGVKEYQVP